MITPVAVGGFCVGVACGGVFAGRHTGYTAFFVRRGGGPCDEEPQQAQGPDAKHGPDGGPWGPMTILGLVGAYRVSALTRERVRPALRALTGRVRGFR